MWNKTHYKFYNYEVFHTNFQLLVDLLLYNKNFLYIPNKNDVFHFQFDCMNNIALGILVFLWEFYMFYQ